MASWSSIGWAVSSPRRCRWSRAAAIRRPRVSEFAGGMINSVGLANPGLGSVRHHELPWLAGSHVPRAQVIVNVVGFREEEYAAVVTGLDDAQGFAATSSTCPVPTRPRAGSNSAPTPTSVSRIVSQVRRATKRPIFAKLSPVLPDIATMAEAARDAGADGVSLVNTMPGYLYNGEGPRVGQGNGGISGPALRPVGMLAVRRVAERTRGELPDHRRGRDQHRGARARVSSLRRIAGGYRDRGAGRSASSGAHRQISNGS